MLGVWAATCQGMDAHGGQANDVIGVRVKTNDVTGVRVKLKSQKVTLYLPPLPCLLKNDRYVLSYGGVCDVYEPPFPFTDCGMKTDWKLQSTKACWLPSLPPSPLLVWLRNDRYPLVEFMYLVYLACQVRVTVGDSGLCCCVKVLQTNLSSSSSSIHGTFKNHTHQNKLAATTGTDKTVYSKSIWTIKTECASTQYSCTLQHIIIHSPFS